MPRTYRLQRNAFLLRTLRRLARGERGAVLVETAISFALLLMILFGGIGVSWGVYSYHFLANAAHEATRYAIVRGGSWGTACDSNGGYSASQCTANSGDIASYVANRKFPGISVTAGDVCVEYLGSTPGSSSTTCSAASSTAADNAPGDIVQVTINYPFTLNVPGIPPYTINMSSTSQMVIAN